MEPGAGRIVVWVGQEEKIICGLTKQTTSADIVQALLENQQTAMGTTHVQMGNPKGYYIMEKWRGFQCTLPLTMKMLKLWKAWGTEQVNVRFSLVKSDHIQPCLIWTTADYHKHTDYPHPSTACVIKSFPLHKQQSIVKKTFRKLAKMKKGMDLQEKNSMKKLAQVIASQDLTIKKQIHRMQELDEQIEEYQTYLQLETEDTDEHSAHCSHRKEDEFKQQRCPFLQDKDSSEDLCIKDETNNLYMHSETLFTGIKEKSPPMPIYEWEDLCAGKENFMENGDMCTLQYLRQVVDESLQLGVKLHSFFSCMQEEILYHDSFLFRQNREYDILMQELKLLNESNNLVAYESLQPYNISLSDGSSEELSNITVALSTMSMKSDTDSDTGISSTHSQNSDPVL